MKNIIIPELLKKENLEAFFTTKRSGVSRESVAKCAQIPDVDLYLPDQRHTGRVTVLKSDMKVQMADAVITKRKNILIGVRVADCVPILIYDKARMACGAVHAGWRGTAEGILPNTLREMESEFHSDPEDILIAIGPAIRWCCYEVGPEVLNAVIRFAGDGDYHMEKTGKICLDLPTANKMQAIKMGVPEDQIWMSDECTYCNPERYYSYRYAKRVMGSQGGFIGVIVAYV